MYPLRRSRAAHACLTLLLASISLTACSSANIATDASEPADLPIVNGIPQFEGPWAEDLRRDYMDNDNEYWHKVIANGHISEREYDEHRNRLITCLHDGGLKSAELDKGHVTYADDPALSDQEENQIMTACDDQEASVMFDIWYHNLRANPDNLDWQAAELECLINYGLLQPGATRADVQAWYESEENRQRQKEAYICAKDPFGKLGLAEELAAQSGH